MNDSVYPMPRITCIPVIRKALRTKFPTAHLESSISNTPVGKNLCTVNIFVDSATVYETLIPAFNTLNEYGGGEVQHFNTSAKYALVNVYIWEPEYLNKLKKFSNKLKLYGVTNIKMTFHVDEILHYGLDDFLYELEVR